MSDHSITFGSITISGNNIDVTINQSATVYHNYTKYNEVHHESNCNNSNGNSKSVQDIFDGMTEIFSQIFH